MENKEDVSGGILYKPMCDNEISKVMSEDVALSRKFRIHDLISRHKHNLYVRAHVDFYGGYAEHSRQVIFGLADTGNYNIRLLPLKTPIDIDPITHQRLNYFVYNANVYNENAIFLTIAGVGYLQEKYLDRSKINIGWTMTESVDYPEFCHEWLNNPDYLLCPTDTDLFRAERAGVNAGKLFRVHLGFDEKLYNEKVKPLEICGLENRFVFGYIGSWNTRKSIVEIIKAYFNAFTSKDNVSLLLVSKYGTRPHGEERDNVERWTIKYEFEQILKEYADCNTLPHVAIIDIPVHENILPNIMANMNCLVGFSKGESTWLPGLQAIAMNIPVIQLRSKCSGFVEYLNDSNSYLCSEVEYKVADEELVKGTSEYYEGVVFAHGNIDELSLKMCEVYNTRGLQSQVNKILNAKIESRKWTWANSINSLNKTFNKILGY